MKGITCFKSVLVMHTVAPLLVKRDNIHLAMPNLSRLIRIWPSMTENEVSNEKEMNSLA